MSKIIIIEDNKIIREGLQTLLMGHKQFREVEAFDNSDYLIDNYELLKPDFILIDLSLPNLTGINSIRKIRTIDKAAHILVLTVYDNNDLLFEALRAGASGYILKNSTPERIIEILSDLSNGKTLMSGLIARKVLSVFEKKRERLKGYTRYSLTKDELKILNGLVEGNSLLAIGESLLISPEGIRETFTGIYKKLQMYS